MKFTIFIIYRISKEEKCEDCKHYYSKRHNCSGKIVGRICTALTLPLIYLSSEIDGFPGHFFKFEGFQGTHANEAPVYIFSKSSFLVSNVRNSNIKQVLNYWHNFQKVLSLIHIYAIYLEMQCWVQIWLKLWPDSARWIWPSSDFQSILSWISFLTPS